MSPRTRVCDDGRVTAAPRSEPHPSARPARVARPLERPSAPRLWWRAFVGLAMLGTGVVLALGEGDDLSVPPWLIPLIIYSAALVLVWSPLDAVVAGDAGDRTSYRSCLEMLGCVSQWGWARQLSPCGFSR